MLNGDQETSVVTSGTWSPTFEKAIGMAFLPNDHAVPGTQIEVDVRGKRIPGRVVDLPIYRRKR